MRPIFSPRRFRAYELYYTPGEYGATSDNRFVYHPGNILSAPEWIASNPAPEKPVADESVEPVERLEWDGKLSRNAVWKPAENAGDRSPIIWKCAKIGSMDSMNSPVP
jgi:hypothetical protein